MKQTIDLAPVIIVLLWPFNDELFSHTTTTNVSTLNIYIFGNYLHEIYCIVLCSSKYSYLNGESEPLDLERPALFFLWKGGLNKNDLDLSMNFRPPIMSKPPELDGWSSTTCAALSRIWVGGREEYMWWNSSSCSTSSSER